MHSGSLLIVDDEPSLLKMLSAYLDRRGYRVRAFCCTAEAWSEFEKDPAGYAVVLLDMTLEGLSAEEFGERALRANPDVRVIASSGYPSDLTRLRAAGKDRVAFLQKPFTPEMLAQCIERMTGE